MTLIRSVDPKSQIHWRVHAPLATHHGVLTCAEAGCLLFVTGFNIDCRVDDPAAQARMHYFRKVMNDGEPPARRRHFREFIPGDGMVRFWFPPGTRCFREHRGVVRDPLFAVQPGTGKQSVIGGITWRDDMQEELMLLKEVQQREGIPEATP